MPDTAGESIGITRKLKSVATGCRISGDACFRLDFAGDGSEVVDIEFTRSAGKGTERICPIRTMMDTLKAGDVIVADSLFAPTASSRSGRWWKWNRHCALSNSVNRRGSESRRSQTKL